MLLNRILKCKHFELNLCQVAKHCSSQLDTRPPPISKVKAESSDDSLHIFSRNTSVMPMRHTLKRQHEVTSCTMLLATQSESHPTWVITKPCYSSPQTSQRKHRHTKNMLFDKSQCYVLWERLFVICKMISICHVFLLCMWLNNYPHDSQPYLKKVYLSCIYVSCYFIVFKQL